MAQAGAISADQMRLVLDVSRLLTVTADLDTLLNRIAEAASSLIGAERASIFLHDPRTHELCTRVALGSREIRVPASAGIVGHVFQTNELLEVANPYDDARFNRDVDRKTGFVTRNLLSTPLRDITGAPIGVLQLINHIGGPFTLADHQMIELLADQCGVAIQRHRFQQEAIRSAGLQHEMDLACKVQTAMIPQQPPVVPSLISAGWTRPASVTGGDAYDLWTMGDDRLGIFLADASGHGIAPAIVVSQVRTLVRALSEINCDPAWLLQRVNARLANDLEPGRFATVFFGCMSSDGLLSWASAAHGPMLYRTGATGPFQVLEPCAPPIGVLPELPCDEAPPIRFDPGGVLVILSDGIFEARSPDGGLFEIERVQKLLQTCGDLAPAEMLSVIRESVLHWQGKDEPTDDQTAIIIQRQAS